MRRYSGNGVTPAGTTLVIGMVVQNGATVRARIYDLIVSSDSSPADIATKFSVPRGTVSSTGTNFTPTALDPGDPASLLTFKGGTFSGPTITANSALLFFALNQRATFRWVAVPDSELVIPATTDSWVGVESLSSGGTPNIDVVALWQE